MKVKGTVSLVLIGVKVVGWVAGLACCLEQAEFQGCLLESPVGLLDPVQIVPGLSFWASLLTPACGTMDQIYRLVGWFSFKKDISDTKSIGYVG